MILNLFTFLIMQEMLQVGASEAQNNLKDLGLDLIHFKYIFSVLIVQTAETSNRFLVSILIFKN